jgi:hypothetical protein
MIMVESLINKHTKSDVILNKTKAPENGASRAIELY